MTQAAINPAGLEAAARALCESHVRGVASNDAPAPDKEQRVQRAVDASWPTFVPMVTEVLVAYSQQAPLPLEPQPTAWLYTSSLGGGRISRSVYLARQSMPLGNSTAREIPLHAPLALATQ